MERTISNTSNARIYVLKAIGELGADKSLLKLKELQAGDDLSDELNAKFAINRIENRIKSEQRVPADGD